MQNEKPVTLNGGILEPAKFTELHEYLNLKIFPKYWYQAYINLGRERILALRHQAIWFTNMGVDVTYREMRLPLNAIRLTCIPPQPIARDGTILQHLLNRVNQVTGNNYNSILVEKFRDGEFRSQVLNNKSEVWSDENQNISFLIVGNVGHIPHYLSLQKKRESGGTKNNRSKWIEQKKIPVSMRTLITVPIGDDPWLFAMQKNSDYNAYYVLGFRKINVEKREEYYRKYPCVHCVLPIERIQSLVTSKTLLTKEEKINLRAKAREQTKSPARSVKAEQPKPKKRKIDIAPARANAPTGTNAGATKRPVITIAIGFLMNQLIHEIEQSPGYCRATAAAAGDSGDSVRNWMDVIAKLPLTEEVKYELYTKISEHLRDENTCPRDEIKKRIEAEKRKLFLRNMADLESMKEMGLLNPTEMERVEKLAYDNAAAEQAVEEPQETKRLVIGLPPF
jgi:hypothetical protein